MRYELSDDEWSVIKLMLQNKLRGLPRVDDRRVLNGIFWVLHLFVYKAPPAKSLIAAHSRCGGWIAVASPARMNSINCVRPMGHRDGESASTAGKELRRMGSALFGNNLDRFR
jgi:hypothetical protein